MSMSLHLHAASEVEHVGMTTSWLGLLSGAALCDRRGTINYPRRNVSIDPGTPVPFRFP